MPNSLATARFMLNQKLINPQKTRAQAIFLALVVLLSVSLRLATTAWADDEAALVTVVTINSRVVFCDPPGRYDGETAYLPASFVSRYLGINVKRTSAVGTYALSAYDNTLSLAVGASVGQLNQEILDIQTPQERDGELLVPVELLVQGFAVGAEIEEPAQTAPIVKLTLPGANVQDIRLGEHPDRVRVVLDLDRPAGYIWSVDRDTVAVEVAVPAGQPHEPPGLRLLSFDSPAVERIAQSPTADGFTRVVIAGRECELRRIFTLSNPPRIVVDLAIPQPPKPELPIAPPPGVRPDAGRWQKRNLSTPRGPVTGYVLTINPARDGLEVRPALADQTVHCRSSVLHIARRAGAVAALNGGFFARQGPPLGLLIVDGEWIKHPIFHRTALGVTAGGKLLMDRLSFDGRLYFERHGYLQLDGINRGHDELYWLVVYTPRWGESLAAAGGATRLAVTGDGQITAKETTGAKVAIPEGGYVISGQGRYAELLDRVQVGERVRMDLSTTPIWNNIRHAIGGGPRLVKEGRLHVTASPERFRADIALGATSRSALAITANGGLMLVAVETPPDQPGDGVTLAEFAQILVKLGARDAMNLDGGGSVTVVQDTQVINNPSDGWTRAVSNALVVVPVGTG